MPSIQDHQSGFTPARQLRPWMHDQKSIPYQAIDSHRTSLAQPAEILRPMEPANTQNAPMSYLPTRINHIEQGQQRQQLPGLQELLSPPVGTGPSSSYPTNWSSVNSTQPSWQDASPSTSTQQSHGGRFSQLGPMPVNPTPPPFHRLSLDVSPIDRFAQHSPNVHLNARPSLPVPPPPSSLRNVPDFQGQRAVEQLPPPSHVPESAGSAQTHATSGFLDSASDRVTSRRFSTLAGAQKALAASNYSLQCVGQRHIPGEGMCYVFKDGSTCPTVIDGEPVNPLWGTTKAGKARKRLAQACLNCREKKIKCEPGESSCLQCEKAKRECHRPPAPQLQAELASSATLTVPNPPLGRAEWSSQSSGSVAMTDIQTQKRRRSAQAAQQDVLNLPPNWSRERSPQSVKRRKSDVSASSVDELAIERQRKDSKRIDVEDMMTAQPGPEVFDPSSWDEDPYQIDPEATMRFLELFFAQASREVNIMFPRRSFTHWVRHCRDKCQRECMVLHAVLALGSTFAENEFASFAKLCAERAALAVSRIDGKFSVALVQARLLVAAYYHLNGKDAMGWDLSGSAIRVISAMRLNSEDGCSDDLDEYARRYYNLTQEQLRECRRRTFWTAFLVDRYHGFCGGLLSAIQPEDIQLRLPCPEQIYEDGVSSDSPFFDYSQPCVGVQHTVGSSTAHNPAAYTMAIASLWTDVIKLIYRSPRQLSGSMKGYESSIDNVQARLLEWRHALPPHLQYSRQALIEAIQHGYAGSLVSMYALYHIAQLKSARNSHIELLSARSITRQIQVAHSHSIELLEMVCDLRSTKLQGSGKGQDPINLLSPFFAYGITAAIDTLSAGGLREDLGRTTAILSESVATLHDLAQFCASAKTQARQTSKRMTQIEVRAAACFEEVAVVAAPRAIQNQGANDCWRLAEPMEKQFSLQQDVSYGVTAAIYFSALREGR